jgi:3-deoxy-manno-octulosonate cytidylyltransferase (CMP-KDO synthetase)
MSQFLIVIPARYASSRFPGKPLVDIRGKSMIQRVYEQCQKSRLADAVGVATDDERICEHVEGFGGTAWMTSEAHRSGTDRVAEVAAMMPDYDYIINVQGDEPMLPPEQIDIVCGLLQDPEAEIGTLVCDLTDPRLLQEPNIVKVVRDENGRALYFSRSPIPYMRGVETALWTQKHRYFRHIGIYGFRQETLLQLTQLPVHALEQTESLEQLRWLAHGYQIQTALGPSTGIGVDSPEDLQRLLRYLDRS